MSQPPMAAPAGGVAREGGSPEAAGLAGDGVEGLSQSAGRALAEGELQGAAALLQKLLRHREQDPKVLHNMAVTDYLMCEERDPQKLLTLLEQLKQRLDDARAEAELGDSGGLNAAAGDVDVSLISYNTAVVLYQLKQFARCRSILEGMFGNIEPVDEFLAFKVCFLLLDVCLLLRQPDKAMEVLAYLERSYVALTKSDKTGGGNEGGADGWPNKKSTRHPPTDISAEEVRTAMNLYKAKLALMARSSKASKREIKTTLNACVQNTTGLFLKCNFEYTRQNYRKAIKLLSNSCQKNDADENLAALYFNNMGCIHHLMRRHRAASFYLSRALHENALLASTHSTEDGGPKLPVFSCDRACEIEFNRGLQMLFNGRAERAFTCFLAAMPLLHRQPRLWLRLGESCVAVHLQAEQATHGVVSAVGRGSTRWLMESRRPEESSGEARDEAEEAAGGGEQPGGPTKGEKDGPAPTLAFGAQALRNALLLSSSALSESAGATADFPSLVRLSVQGVLSSSEEHALQMHAVERLALIKLAWIALVERDQQQALGYANQLLATADAPNNMKVFGHLYACDALCQMSKSADALKQLSSALQLGEALAEVLAYQGGDANGSEGDVESVSNLYGAPDSLHAAGSPGARAVLFTNLATVHILQGQYETAEECTQRALTMRPDSRPAQLCRAYLELAKGNTATALTILTRLRLPPLLL